MYIEFYGVSRERAGVAALQVDAATLGQVLDALAVRCPCLAEFISGGALHPAFAANLNGDAFVSDPTTPLSAHDHLLILSADVGG